MTLLEITYELQSPLNNEQLRKLGEFANTYGLRRFRVDETAKRLTFEYDASRLNETEVANVLRRAGVPVKRKGSLGGLTFAGGGRGSSHGINELQSSKKSKKVRGPIIKVGLLLGNRSPEERTPTSRSFLDRGVGSSILASLSEAGGNALHKPTRKPLPPRAPEFAGRHLECAHAGHPASLRPSSFG